MDPLLQPCERSRCGYAVACVLTVAAGLTSRRYPQLLPAAIGKYPGDALWTLMVFFGLGALCRGASTHYPLREIATNRTGGYQIGEQQ